MPAATPDATRLLTALCALASAACSAHMVNQPGSTTASPYAPVNEAARGGVMKYNNKGAGSIREARRNDAYRKMYAACGGKYRIDSEGPRSDGGSVIPVPYGGAVWLNSQDWYIQFSCVRDSAAESTSTPTPGVQPIR